MFHLIGSHCINLVLFPNFFYNISLRLQPISLFPVSFSCSFSVLRSLNWIILMFRCSTFFLTHALPPPTHSFFFLPHPCLVILQFVWSHRLQCLVSSTFTLFHHFPFPSVRSFSPFTCSPSFLRFLSCVFFAYSLSYLFDLLHFSQPSLTKAFPPFNHLSCCSCNFCFKSGVMVLQPNNFSPSVLTLNLQTNNLSSYVKVNIISIELRVKMQPFNHDYTY